MKRKLMSVVLSGAMVMGVGFTLPQPKDKIFDIPDPRFKIHTKTIKKTETKPPFHRYLIPRPIDPTKRYM
jgi:hypothetical protein